MMKTERNKVQAVKQMKESARVKRNAEEQQIETDDFVEDSYDYDNHADYISSEESDSDCKGTVYPERDTVNIYVEESLNVIQGDGDKEQVEIGKSSIKLVNVQKETIHIATSKNTNMCNFN
ncbi:uncharacterized protein LOC127835015 [Dreissena polymorpha]|uniref:uncharacterized protein LOC127835015 n=1 Tax=Dreissena polymorpha TaxID=45954 RepID=UPI002264C763|nr:uncharacterized protein LOC127835015 [Dreissena polymorpha]